jgi:hypothetical protein
MTEKSQQTSTSSEGHANKSLPDGAPGSAHRPPTLKLKAVVTDTHEGPYEGCRVDLIEVGPKGERKKTAEAVVIGHDDSTYNNTGEKENVGQPKGTTMIYSEDSNIAFSVKPNNPVSVSGRAGEPTPDENSRAKQIASMARKACHIPIP